MFLSGIEAYQLESIVQIPHSPSETSKSSKVKSEKGNYTKKTSYSLLFVGPSQKFISYGACKHI